MTSIVFCESGNLIKLAVIRTKPDARYFLFFGMYIRMYHADHPPAHFHAEYQRCGAFAHFIELGALCWRNGLELSPTALHYELQNRNKLARMQQVA